MSFTLCIFSILFGSFCFFVWTQRTELISTLISRSCPPYTASIESVSFSRGSLTIKNLVLRNEEQSILINHLIFSGKLSSWISYALLPGQRALELDEAFFSSSPTLQGCSGPSSPPILIHLKQIHFDSNQFTDVTGTIPQILALSKQRVIKDSAIFATASEPQGP